MKKRVQIFHRFSVSPLFRHQAATASTPDLALIATHPLLVPLAAAVAAAVAVAVVASFAVSKTRRHTEEDYMAL